MKRTHLSNFALPTCFAAMAILCFVIVAQPTTAAAQEREVLGYGYLFTNDHFGDSEDRWRTASSVLSLVRGYKWTGSRPDTFGEIVEFRFGGEIIAPSKLAPRASGDRRYAGVLTFGIHTHLNASGAEISTGVDLVLVGQQTGMAKVQNKVHRFFGKMPPKCLNDQIENSTRLRGTVEIAKSYKYGLLKVRPFFELSAGVEEVARFGFDAFWGLAGRDNLLLRDVTTGHLYYGTNHGVAGLTFVVGGDYAAVGDSIYLPDSEGPSVKRRRSRLRAGLHWQNPEGMSLFYGLTYLTEEFLGQNEGQMIGSLNVNFSF